MELERFGQTRELSLATQPKPAAIAAPASQVVTVILGSRQLSGGLLSPVGAGWNFSHGAFLSVCPERSNGEKWHKVSVRVRPFAANLQT